MLPRVVKSSTCSHSQEPVHEISGLNFFYVASFVIAILADISTDFWRNSHKLLKRLGSSMNAPGRRSIKLSQCQCSSAYKHVNFCRHLVLVHVRVARERAPCVLRGTYAASEMFQAVGASLC